MLCLRFVIYLFNHESIFRLGLITSRYIKTLPSYSTILFHHIIPTYHSNLLFHLSLFLDLHILQDLDTKVGGNILFSPRR